MLQSTHTNHKGSFKRALDVNSDDYKKKFFYQYIVSSETMELPRIQNIDTCLVFSNLEYDSSRRDHFRSALN